MAQQRLPVRKIREVLRLKAAGLSDRKIAATIGSARSTVQECLRRAYEAGMCWPLSQDLDENALHARLYRRAVPLSRHPQPDFAQLHAELSRPGVTRLLLWQEYKTARPDGWQYSVFCDRYRRWLATQELVLRQNHAPGEKGFVDYAGQTVQIIDRHSGESRDAQIFVAVLGCSNYTYAEATWTQALPDWLGSHVRALEFFGGAPSAIVPDNLKSGVTRAHRYQECGTLKRWLAKILRAGDTDIQLSLVNATLEHLFEDREIAKYFEDWRMDPSLARAYSDAMLWPEQGGTSPIGKKT